MIFILLVQDTDRSRLRVVFFFCFL